MSKRITVDTKQQILEAYDGSSLKFHFDCITGDAAHPTDIGHFAIFRKRNPCFSTEYRVPMNYALFFTKDGKAIHQFYLPEPFFAIDRISKEGVSDWFGSHGCVRLREADAQSLFQWATIGTAVVVS